MHVRRGRESRGKRSLNSSNAFGQFVCIGALCPMRIAMAKCIEEIQLHFATMVNNGFPTLTFKNIVREFVEICCFCTELLMLSYILVLMFFFLLP